MELRPGSLEEIGELRRQKLASYRIPLLPEFHQHLVGHAEVYGIWEGSSSIGYALLLRDRHETHDHVTLLEIYLTPPFSDRYEDALASVREAAEPRVYLARSDECLVETALIAQGYPMENGMSILAARTVAGPGESADLALVPLDLENLQAAHDIFAAAVGADQSPSLSQLEHSVGEDAFWLLTERAEPIGLVAQEQSGGARYGLLDIMAPSADERALVWALLKAGQMVERSGRTPAAVVDARDTRKFKAFRSADYYTAATYLVFYDPLAGRPSVSVLTREQLWHMIVAKEEFHLIDVLGEEHWRAGHLPGAEWLEFRNLSREARRRYAKDEPIVVYCNDFT
jgi:hypothetical protein